MPLKDSLRFRFEKLADDVVPRLLESWGDVQKRLDDLNCSLADRAVPEHRRGRVSELSLQAKARQAGQGRAGLRNKRERPAGDARQNP